MPSVFNNPEKVTEVIARANIAMGRRAGEHTFGTIGSLAVVKTYFLGQDNNDVQREESAAYKKWDRTGSLAIEEKGAVFDAIESPDQLVSLFNNFMARLRDGPPSDDEVQPASVAIMETILGNRAFSVGSWYYTEAARLERFLYALYRAIVTNYRCRDGSAAAVEKWTFAAVAAAIEASGVADGHRRYRPDNYNPVLMPYRPNLDAVLNIAKTLGRSDG